MKQQNGLCPSDRDASPDEIAAFIKKIKFRKKLFGGVDEYAVWKTIRKLDEMYNEAMKTQRIEYEARIAERDRRNATYPEDRAEGDASGKA